MFSSIVGIAIGYFSTVDAPPTYKSAIGTIEHFSHQALALQDKCSPVLIFVLILYAFCKNLSRI